MFLGNTLTLQIGYNFTQKRLKSEFPPTKLMLTCMLITEIMGRPTILDFFIEQECCFKCD